MTNHYEIIDSFKTAMRDSGISPPDQIIGDSNLHRFKIDGKLNGAYVLHLDGSIPAGYFEDFKQGIKCTWRLAGQYQPLSHADTEAFKKLAAIRAAELKPAINRQRARLLIYGSTPPPRHFCTHI